MKELGITKGEWYWDGDPTNYDHENEAPWLIAGGVPIITGEIEAKNKSDVDLIVDAGNTAQKCGLLPSELLQQRDELKELYDWLKEETADGLSTFEMPHDFADVLRSRLAAIKKTER